MQSLPIHKGYMQALKTVISSLEKKNCHINQCQTFIYTYYDKYTLSCTVTTSSCQFGNRFQSSIISQRLFYKCCNFKFNFYRTLFSGVFQQKSYGGSIYAQYQTSPLVKLLLDLRGFREAIVPFNNSLLRCKKYTQMPMFSNIRGGQRVRQSENRITGEEQVNTGCSKVNNTVKTETYKKNSMSTFTHVQIYQGTNNQGQLVASSHCVPHCHFEISLSRLKQNIEAELMQCLSDSSFGCQFINHNLKWLFRTNTSKMVWGTQMHTQTPLKLSLQLTDAE